MKNADKTRGEEEEEEKRIKHSWVIQGPASLSYSKVKERKEEMLSAHRNT